MNQLFEAHLDRLKSKLIPGYAANTYADWLVENMILKGDKFSFKGHEYQRVVLDSTAKHKVIKKCSQIGISVLSIGFTLAFCNLHNGVTVIYILPTAGFSQTFAKGRVDPIIDESPTINGNIYPGSDSSLMKRFINNSFVYFKGASRSHQAISVDADALIFDEKDFAEDIEVLTKYTSRLTHSKHKIKLELSTPTVSGYGISSAFDASKQHVELQKCQRCNHWFKPDYFKHVRLPGFTGDIRKFNYFSAMLLDKYDTDAAFLECPRCGGKVDQSIENREWVVVNENSQSHIDGFHITPFSAPEFITPGYLIETSTTYKDYADFINFGLGESHDSSENSLGKEELERLFVRQETGSGVRVYGMDLGGTCAAMVGRVDPVGQSLFIEWAEAIPLHNLTKRYKELCAEYGVICSVSDALPYTDIILRMQAEDPNLWGALFTSSKNVELYTYKHKEEDEEKATYGLRQIDISRNKMLDFVVNMLRCGRILFKDGPWKRDIIEHLTDLKRIKIHNRYGEEEFVWRKSDKGTDHYFFALLYLVTAYLVRGMSKGTMSLPWLVSPILNRQGAQDAPGSR